MSIRYNAHLEVHKKVRPFTHYVPRVILGHILPNYTDLAASGRGPVIHSFSKPLPRRNSRGLPGKSAVTCCKCASYRDLETSPSFVARGNFFIVVWPKPMCRNSADVCSLHHPLSGRQNKYAPRQEFAAMIKRLIRVELV